MQLTPVTSTTPQLKDYWELPPAGVVSFVLDLYTGRNSDKNAAQNTKLYVLLEHRDSVMADKGFDIENY